MEPEFVRGWLYVVGVAEATPYYSVVPQTVTKGDGYNYNLFICLKALTPGLGYCVGFPVFTGLESGLILFPEFGSENEK